MELRLKFAFVESPQDHGFDNENAVNSLLASLDDLCTLDPEKVGDTHLEALKRHPESRLEIFVHESMKCVAGEGTIMYPPNPSMHASESNKFKCPPGSYTTLDGFNLKGNVDCATELTGNQLGEERWPRVCACEVKRAGLVKLTADGKLGWPQDWVRQAVGQLDSCFNKERACGHIIVSDGRTWVFIKGTREAPTADDEPPVSVPPGTSPPMPIPPYLSSP